MTDAPAPAPAIARTTHRRRPADHRCRINGCTRLLWRGYLPAGAYLEIRCPKCGHMHTWGAEAME